MARKVSDWVPTPGHEKPGAALVIFHGGPWDGQDIWLSDVFPKSVVADGFAYKLQEEWLGAGSDYLNSGELLEIAYVPDVPGTPDRVFLG